MWMQSRVLFVFYVVSLCLVKCDDAINDVSKSSHNTIVAENRMSAQIFALIEHYKQIDPVGIPGAPVPDPFPVPEVKKSVGLGTLTMKGAKAYGFSKFRIKSVKVDVNDLMVKAVIQLDAMEVKGNYTLAALFSSANGPFTIQLKNVVATANASVAVERDGKIRTQEITMDITFADMVMNFQNLGFAGSIFQGFVNSAPTLVFDTIKPFMLKEAYTKMKTEIDKNLEKIMGENSFPNSISPLDMAIAEARQKVRQLGYDPLILKNYNHSVGMFAIKLSNSWMSGASSFYRFGDILTSLKNNTLTIELHVGTQEIKGSTQWEISAGKGMITRAGSSEFVVQHVKASFIVSQTLDTRNKPKMEDLQLELGNIQVRNDGAGTLDYIIEAIVNILPNLLRYQIMDALENPAKARIQEEMNKIDVEKLLKKKILEFEKHGMNMTFDMNL